VLLDTNIWRYVVNIGSQGALLRIARDGLYDVQIAPAVLHETLRLKNASLRATLVRLMTNSRFHRLMPEAYSESMEILREIERIRP
jgi:predicted nucleic acid-binding protein